MQELNGKEMTWFFREYVVLNMKLYQFPIWYFNSHQSATYNKTNWSMQSFNYSFYGVIWILCFLRLPALRKKEDETVSQEDCYITLNIYYYCIHALFLGVIYLIVDEDTIF